MQFVIEIRKIKSGKVKHEIKANDIVKKKKNFLKI